MLKPKIKVLVADDHTLMREGLKQIIELEEDIEVVALAIDGEDAIKKSQSFKPDVILLDINMPNLNGIQTLRRLKDIDTNFRVIMLTIHEAREYLLETINIGASGYLLKDLEAENLIKAIRDVHDGKTYIQPSLATYLIKGEGLSSCARKDKLTKREYEVLSLIADGKNNKEIAEELFISEKTVKNHVSNILKKIEVSDRTQAAIYAYKFGIKKI